MREKYTKEMLEVAVRDSCSISAVIRKLGCKNKSGGMHTHISRRVKKLGIDTSHFVAGWKTANIASVNRVKKTADEILTKSDKKHKPHQLRRALMEVGRNNECEKCHIGNVWQGEEIILEIDHINGDRNNNLQKNLRILCPNCHSQTPTFRRYKR